MLAILIIMMMILMSIMAITIIEDSPRDHDLPPTCSIAFLAGPAGEEMVIV